MTDRIIETMTDTVNESAGYGLGEYIDLFTAGTAEVELLHESELAQVAAESPVIPEPAKPKSEAKSGAKPTPETKTKPKSKPKSKTQSTLQAPAISYK